MCGVENADSLPVKAEPCWHLLMGLEAAALEPSYVCRTDLRSRLSQLRLPAEREELIRGKDRIYARGTDWSSNNGLWAQLIIVDAESSKVTRQPNKDIFHCQRSDLPHKRAELST